jgi:hypothetical protein
MFARSFLKTGVRAAKGARSFHMTPMARAISLKDAKSLPSDYNEMPNDIIQVMAVDGDMAAKEERLIRNIMAVDNKEWEDARVTFTQIKAANRSGATLLKLPYYSGLFVAVTSAFASIPLCFDLQSVLSFNEAFVTQPVPEAEDLETMLEVGIWSWNWMEPPLGQASFFLLCMQFARAQMQNVHVKPYTEFIKSSRASRICGMYPQYSKAILSDFSEEDLFRDD